MLQVVLYSPYAPVKLFCPHPPPGSSGVREKRRVIKKGEALQKREIKVFI